MSDELALSGKVGTEVEVPGVSKPVNKAQVIDTLTRALLERDIPEAEKLKEIEMQETKYIFDAEATGKGDYNVSAAYRALCQRVTELEAKMAELLEEKNEPPDPDWERERGYPD